MLAFFSRVGERLSHVGGVRNCLAANIEDHVAGLDAALRGRPLGIDTNYRDTAVTGAGNIGRGGEC